MNNLKIFTYDKTKYRVWSDKYKNVFDFGRPGIGEVIDMIEEHVIQVKTYTDDEIREIMQKCKISNDLWTNTYDQTERTIACENNSSGSKGR
jgi:hypothetical protein